MEQTTSNTEAQTSEKDLKKSEEAEKQLENDFIFKKSTNLPQAVYFCKLCSLDLNNIEHAHKHIKKRRHKMRYKAKQQDEQLKQLKSPPKAAMEALQHLLESVIAENMMSNEDAREWKEVLKRLDEIASNGEPDKFKDVVKDGKVHRIEMTDTQTNLRCSLSANNTKALNTTGLLRIYGRIEPLVVKLSLLLRYWGHLCHVDRQSEGSLPPHSFTLMVIFYLQKKHNLPVLHEIMAEHDIDAILDEMSDEHKQLQLSGDSWLYCPTAPPGDKKSEKSEDVDDDGDNDEIADFSVEFQKNEPVLSVEGKDETAETDNISLDPVELPKCFEGKETPSLAKLWLDLLKFYSVQFDMESWIITIRSSSEVTCTDRGWPHCRIAIEDPCSTKQNLCKPMNTQMFSHFMRSLKHSVFYFHTAHLPQPSQKQETDKTKVNFEQELNYDSCYKFTKESLTDGKTHTMDYFLCKKERHMNNCLDEVKEKVDPLPPLTEHLKKMLDVVCMDTYNTCRPESDEEAMRDQVCNSLLRYLQQHFDPNVEICLFGSSRNRFTFRGSDLDICMTFKGNETGEGLNFAKIIEELVKVLQQSSDFDQIEAITNAKVPIVKFKHPKSDLEGDISLYNLLAKRNTYMLAMYALIDKRCHILGYAIKEFAKRCCIGDASRGSLSSYAYTLLMIYFLQQRDPPVLPVLQELYKGKESPEVIVKGWNSWFYEDIENLGKVWEGKNKESIGELWLGFFRFYTEGFNFRQRVVSIRQKENLTADKKNWTSKYICIEDPFELNHNLGKGVSSKMAKFIMKVFLKGRERFGTDPGNAISNPREYFFDAQFLMDGQKVPNDRCCSKCGKIGHFSKACPKKRSGQGKNKNGDAPSPSPAQSNGISQASHHNPSSTALLPTTLMHYEDGLPQPINQAKRNLANDFELAKNLIAERSISESPRRDPVTSNPSTQLSRSTCHGRTLKGAKNEPLLGISPCQHIQKSNRK